MSTLPYTKIDALIATNLIGGSDPPSLFELHRGGPDFRQRRINFGDLSPAATVLTNLYYFEKTTGGSDRTRTGDLHSDSVAF